MKFPKNLILLAVCCQPISGLVTPTRQHTIASPRTTIQKTRLGSDAVAEVPKGGGESGGTATIPNEVFNLIKSIVGAGVLSLPAGMQNVFSFFSFCIFSLLIFFNGNKISHFFSSFFYMFIGVAAFGNAPSAVIPSTIIITLMGVISAYTFGLIGKKTFFCDVCSFLFIPFFFGTHDSF